MVQRLLMVLPYLIRCSTNSVIHNAVISQDECVPISCRVSSSSYRNGGLGGTESQVGREREISFVLAAASLAQPKVNALSSARQCVDGAAENLRVEGDHRERAISPRWSAGGCGYLHGCDEFFGVWQELVHVAGVVGVDDRDEQVLVSAVGDIGEVEALDLWFGDSPRDVPLRVVEPQDARVAGTVRIFVLGALGDGHVDDRGGQVAPDRARVRR